MVQIKMDLEKRLDIYKAEYYFQIDFKEKLYARLAIYAVLITACITANITMFDALILNFGILLTWCIFFWAVMIILLFLTLLCFYCQSHTKLDNWTNTPSDMESYRNTLENHFITHSQNIIPNTNFEIDKQNYVNDEYTIYLVDQYSQCSTIIRDNNIYRQRWLLKIMSLTYAQLVITGILGFIYLLTKV